MIVPLPYGVEHPHYKKSVVNWAFISLNVLFFIAAPSEFSDPERYRIFVNQYGLLADDPGIGQFLTHMFMHANIFHIIGNMIFLWVFGNYVNQALGDLHYFFFYLAVGLLAGIAHVITVRGNIPLIGASGAVMGVVGAFLALHGKDKVKLVLLLLVFPVYWFRVPAYVICLFWFAKDLWQTVFASGGNVATGVHVLGCVAGFVYILLLTALNKVERTHYDLLTYFFGNDLGPTEINPVTFNAASAQRTGAVGQSQAQPLASQPSPKPYSTQHTSQYTTQKPQSPPVLETMPPLRKQTSVPQPRPAEAIKSEQDYVEELLRARDSKDFDTMIRIYKILIRNYPATNLPVEFYQQMANVYYEHQHYLEAIHVCQRLLKAYPEYEGLAQIYYILGLLYMRGPNDRFNARSYLEKCLKICREPALRTQAETLVEEILGKAVMNKPDEDTNSVTQANSADQGRAGGNAATQKDLIHEMNRAHEEGMTQALMDSYAKINRYFPAAFLEEELCQHIAEAYYQSERHQDAINICLRILANFPGSQNRAHTHYILGMLYCNSLQDKYHGRSNLEQCLRNNPDPDLRVRAQALLDTIIKSGS